jgi:hypothetical protein
MPLRSSWFKVPEKDLGHTEDFLRVDLYKKRWVDKFIKDRSGNYLEKATITDMELYQTAYVQKLSVKVYAQMQIKKLGINFYKYILIDNNLFEFHKWKGAEQHLLYIKSSIEVIQDVVEFNLSWKHKVEYYYKPQTKYPPRIYVFMHAEIWQPRNFRTMGLFGATPWFSRPMNDGEIEYEKESWRMHAYQYESWERFIETEQTEVDVWNKQLPGYGTHYMEKILTFKDKFIFAS